MATESVKLLSVWASPFSMRAALALAFKNIPYENLPQDLTDKSKLLLDSNPVHKKIPVLIHNGNPVPESLIIVQYIDEAWPSPDGKDLLPKDPYDRAVARFWADYVDKKIFDAMFGILKTTGEERKAAIEVCGQNLATLEEALKTVAKESPFFGGATVGYVDIILGPLATWYQAFEAVGEFTIPFEEKLPCLQAWVKAFKESSVGASLPDSQKLTEFFLQLMKMRAEKQQNKL